MAKLTIAQLEEKVLQLEAQNEKLLTESGSKEIIDAKDAEIETLKTEKAALEKTVEEQSGIIEELSKDNAKASSSSDDNTLKIEGTLYKMLGPKFYIGTSLVTIKELKSNPDLAVKAKELGMLVEVSKKKK